MNRVILIGRLTRDPELRYTQSNQAVATFTLAIDRRMSREKRQEAESQNRPTADFIRITVWGRPAETASKYLRKGSQCAVEGRIQTGSYQDQTGKTVYTTDVVADNVEFLGSRSDNQQSNYNQSNPYDNQDYNNNDYSQTRGYQGNNYNQNQNDFGGDDFFDDDFTEIEDDGRIPF